MNNYYFTAYLIGIILFGVGQTLQMLESTQGVILSMFIANLFFVTYMTIISFRICNKKFDSNAIKTLIIYSLGIFSYGGLSIILCIKNTNNSWQNYDTVNFSLIALILFFAYFSIGIKKLKLFLIAIVKGIPQTTFAFSILFEGKLGVSLEMIVIFHLLTLPRVYQTYKIWKDNKEDSNKRIMFISESVNEFTWTLATIAFVLTWKKRAKPRFF